MLYPDSYVSFKKIFWFSYVFISNGFFEKVFETVDKKFSPMIFLMEKILSNEMGFAKNMQNKSTRIQVALHWYAENTLAVRVMVQNKALSVSRELNSFTRERDSRQIRKKVFMRI